MPTTATDTEPLAPAEGTPLIYAALSRIAAEIGRFQKTGRGPASQGAYPFLPVDSIVDRLNPLLVEHGVIVVPRTEHAQQSVERFPKVNMNGEPVYDGKATPFQALTLLRYEFDFINVVDGSKVTAVAWGESADSGDKGVRRAATAAYKEVLLRTFTIVSGDEDPDAAAPQDTEPVIARQDRGEQMRERATRAPRERAERAPRARGERAAKAAEPTEEAAAERADEAAAATPEPEPTPEAPAETITEQATNRRAQHWAAEGTQPGPDEEPAAAAEAPTTRPATRQRPAAPTVEKREPETAAEERLDSIADVRAAIRTALQEKGKDRDYANTLGDELTGKPRGQWFANLTDLKAVLKAIREGGESTDDGGF